MAKMGIRTFRKIKRREFFTTSRDFYKGGFDSKMSRREAQLILGIREGATPEIIKIKSHHYKVSLSLNEIF